ncbi:MAG: hypothetical protein A3J69_01085 [Candidatus Levybacteria bacterium RIFCSPHIGHO2_02_FULL_42_12]|nr:MAG: hypothetical protein A2698_01650 [Candidatus Levybacteria bacterium RIFCSPHIGHO2_01_FULL_42_15]OGH33870.1 MAG: hypothetical protein A3J69_01085 [Candidatus Levybacteria bacterium RIFCSPHIGHO2_02_FULL_42_12]OGH42519.1 MAG: hypothetical protein A3B53_03440 [Candidatus Levybacteria bacterium RIFCSPLOWO2_01_FULL_42_15]
MLVDNITLLIKAGNGGNGAATFLRNGQTAKGGPDGGNGGNGGNIYFQGSTNTSDLKQFRFQKKIRATDGVSGKRKKLFGKNAHHITIYVPIGTRITDMDSGSVIEVTDTTTPFLLAHGGSGGRGNDEFKSSTNQTPMYAEKGTLGEEKKLLLELRLIADIGLIGLPNAGKSSLLAVLTNATPKIGNYPFTTLEPNIGMLGKHPIADIPGLIEGASRGRGLGIAFLKHIEKTKILVHCIDSADENPQKAYDIVHQEFQQYSASLLNKPEIILFTKTDLATQEAIKKNKEILQNKGKKVLTCSIYDQESLDLLKQALENLL